MAGLEQIKPGGRIKGLDASGLAEVVSVSWFGSDTVDVVYRVNGRVGQRLVFRSEENSIEVVAGGRAFGFDGDGQVLRLASEAMRIRLAHLFDPYMAVHASRIEALPHQITAVYADMLPRQPLRFLLADDPGAGKTIMAGLPRKVILKRFVGVIDLDPRRPIPTVQKVAESVLAELQRTRGASIKLTLEIEAEAASGFSEGDASVVRDNAKALKFRDGPTGFFEA
jgi:hypothetical protein